MTPAMGARIGLAFALAWLWLGATALPKPWSWLVGVGGTLALAVAAVVAQGSGGGGRGFNGAIYTAAVVAEVLAIMLVSRWLGGSGRAGLLPPAVGVIVGMHFLGLYAATGVERFITLAVALTLLNALACFLPAAGPGPRIAAGLGSAAVLAGAVVL